MSSGRLGRWEDRVPFNDMESGLVPLTWRYTWKDAAPDLSDVVAGRLPDAPHLLAIWEPLHTKAPSPARCTPYCCLVRTVIFYHRPYVVGWARGGRGMDGVFHPDWNKGFLEYDQIETRLSSDDLVDFDGDRFEIGGGHVRWWRKRWWMRRWARRKLLSENRQHLSVVGVA